MSFRKNIYDKLTKYMNDKHTNIQKGKWQGVKRDHIINKLDYKINLLEKYRDSFFQNKVSNIKLHRCFHHLNSSQAMCINYFYPLIEEQRLNIVLSFLGFSSEEINYSTVQFEKDSAVDGVSNRRPTSFDFYFETKSKKKFFFEIKFTENGFGKAKKDEEHIDKFEKIYKHNLNSIAPDFQDLDSFLENYQVMRNIINVEENSFVVFLYPIRNKAVHNKANIAKTQMLINDFKNSLFCVTWEKLILHTINDHLPEKLMSHYKEFKYKYDL